MPDWSKHLLAEADGRIRELTSAEEVRLFEKLRPDFHGLVNFALATGLRLSNCRELKWTQVNFEAGLITVTVKSKSHAGDRIHTLPITREMAAILGAGAERHPELVFTYLCQQSIKGRRRGQRLPFTQNGWRKAWRQALEAAG